MKKNDLKVFKFPNNPHNLERQVEAILFSAEEPLDEESIKAMFENSDKAVDLFTAYFERNKYHKEIYDIIEYAIKQFTLGADDEI